MAMSGSVDTAKWISDDGQNMFHRFEWSAVRSGYTSTVSYKVTIQGTDTDEWVKQNIESLKIIANGSTKVDKYTNWTGYYIYSDRPANTAHTVLLSGSFTVDHSYNDGSASFSVSLLSDFYVENNNAQYSGSATCILDSINVGVPSIVSIEDNGDNTITVKYDYGENLVGDTGYLYLKTSNDVSNSNYGYSKSINKSNDRTKSVVISLDDISDISRYSSSIKKSNNIYGKFYQYNSSYLKASNLKSGSAIYYRRPGVANGITNTTNNKYNKYTPTSIITFRWNAPSSGCDGYRIRVYVNYSAKKINGNDTYIDITNTTYSIDCNTLGLKAGDIVYIGIVAYSLNGQKTKLTSAQQYSDTISLVPDKNFIAHAKINGEWKKVNLIHAKFYNGLTYSYKEVQNINN